MPTHAARIQKAIDFIEDRLEDDDLSTELVAREAGYSSWHFQRLFGALLGESVQAYVRRRRLTRAWEQLRASDARIIEIALGAGFESQEAFTRAFKAMFGLPPGTLRRKPVSRAAPMGRPRITPGYIDHLFGGLTMTPQIIDAPVRHIVGLPTQFIAMQSPDANNFDVLPKLWGRYLPRRGEIAGTKGWTDYGLVTTLPEGAERHHPDEYWYLAGAEVERPDAVPPGMTLKTVPAGRYAVFTHKGPLDRLEHTMKYIFGVWLPQSEHELRAAPDVEVYGPKFKPGAEESEMEIQIPIK